MNRAGRLRILRTQRLRLEPFAADQVEELSAVFGDAGVRRYLLDDVVVDEEWVLREIAGSRRRFEQPGSAGLWIAKLAERPAAVVGFVGFRPFFDPPELQLLYGFLPEAWGKGLATEAARAAMRWAFARGLAVAVAATDSPNRASLAVMRRLGMRYREVRSEDGELTIVWHVDRAGFERVAPTTPLRVLVVCTHNSARSQMAEALLRSGWPDCVSAASAGTAPTAVHPMAVAVLDEVGVPSFGLSSKTTAQATAGDEPFDVVVSVCDSARETCPYVPARQETMHRAFLDPSVDAGSQEQSYRRFARVRDEIVGWLEDEVPRWLEVKWCTPGSL